MPVDGQTAHIPTIGDGSAEPVPVASVPDSNLMEVTEDVPETPETPETPPETLAPLGLKDVLRVVVFGGCERLGGHIALSGAFTVKPAGVVADPDSIFEAGICAASADVLIFDLVGVAFGDVVEFLSVVRDYVPRAVTVALLEPGNQPETMPQCGIQLSIAEPFTPYLVAKSIERLMFGTEL